MPPIRSATIEDLQAIVASLGDFWGERDTTARGATALKAITRPGNSASEAFHRALGFAATEHAGYTASGEPRMVFWRELD